ncbi:MAG: glycerophosphodiester phosphodiesterase family protein [Gemmatimonadaceae bacterium]
MQLPPVVIGHRGNAAHAPENTLESFRQAVALGADGVEFDVRLSSDGAVVVMHDALVDRTTDGTGPVANLTLAQLRRLDAGYSFAGGSATHPYRGAGITIPTADEALDATRPLPTIVEVKATAAAEALLRLLQRRGDEERVVVGSFDTQSLAPFRRAGIRTTASRAEVRSLLAPALMRVRRKGLPFAVLSIPPTYRGMPLPLRALARCVASDEVPLHVWTVNDAHLAQRLWRIGVTGILSDDPARILAVKPR